MRWKRNPTPVQLLMVAIADANGKVYWGVGMHEDIILASINALVSAINRLNQVSHFITK